ncbi:hypothetical protein DFH11DRAFT_1727674 [Phellopilus nigrolimitatus]|nr:hypothetical protein DFH11DRAFT_1727674 [Phellopilus nigrolimitatus]
MSSVPRVFRLQKKTTVTPAPTGVLFFSALAHASQTSSQAKFSAPPQPRSHSADSGVFRIRTDVRPFRCLRFHAEELADASARQPAPICPLPSEFLYVLGSPGSLLGILIALRTQSCHEVHHTHDSPVARSDAENIAANCPQAADEPTAA